MDQSDIPTTALSSGLIVAHILKPLGYDTFPVYNYLPDHFPDGPAIAFRRVSLAVGQAKGVGGPCKAVVEIACYHSDYATSIAMAEQVAAAIEGREGRLASLLLRSATLDNASEIYVGDKFVQILTFTLSITPA